MTTIRAFLELPAGLASVSLALQGGARCRPPISRMGNKAGYAHTILDALGLHSGQGAGTYWWAEADPDVAALLRIYPDPDALREVARIIRGWAGEEPRALWERLRAERRARGAARGTVEKVAGWMVSADWAYRQGNPDSGFNPSTATGRSAGCDTFADRADRLAEYAMIASSNRLICVGGPDLLNTGKGGTTHGGAAFSTPPEQVAAGMAGVAAHRGWPPVCVSTSIPTAAEVSAAIGTPGDLSGCVVYADPPYAGTTGYAHDLPRAEVVQYGLAYADMGAAVCVSEQEPIPELMQAGWYATEITADRLGARRTFSKQKAEWLTMSVAPKRCQIGLFNLGEVLHA